MTQQRSDLHSVFLYCSTTLCTARHDRLMVWDMLHPLQYIGKLRITLSTDVTVYKGELLYTGSGFTSLLFPFQQRSMMASLLFFFAHTEKYHHHLVDTLL